MPVTQYGFILGLAFGFAGVVLLEKWFRQGVSG